MTRRKFRPEEIEALKEVASEGIEVVFDKLNIEVGDRGRYLNGSCPVHLGNNPGGFSWHKELGVWKCFTKGCHNRHGSDIVGLIMACLGMKFIDAVSWLHELFDVNFDDVLLERVRNKKCARALGGTVFTKTSLPEDLLLDIPSREEMCSYMVKKRGFLKTTLDIFECGYTNNIEAVFYNRVVIPVRDEDGDLIGFTGRYIGESEAKWLHYGELNNYLFNLHRAAPYIEDSQTIVLTEGPLKVMRLWEAGIKNAVAIFGTSISLRQQRLILGSGAFRLVIAADRDEAGEKMASKIIKGVGAGSYDHIGKYMYGREIFPPEPYLDFDEMPEEKIVTLFGELNENEDLFRHR